MNKYTKRRILAVVLIALIIGLIFLTVPFWAIHLRGEGNFEGNIVLKALVEGYNNNPKSIVGFLCFIGIIMVIGGIPAAIGVVIDELLKS